MTTTVAPRPKFHVLTRAQLAGIVASQLSALAAAVLASLAGLL